MSRSFLHAFATIVLFSAAACSSSSDDAAGGDAPGSAAGAPGGSDGPGTAGGPADPDFGPEGQPTCPTPHFCLEYPRTTTASLHGVAATPAGGLYAVGDGGVVLHSKSKGATWATVPSATTAALRAVAVAGSTVVIVGEKGTILRLVGNALRADALDGKPDLASVWAAAPDDVWAVGADGAHGVVLHFDGSRWSHVDDGALPPLRAVHGSSPTDVWVGGGAMDVAALFHRATNEWTPAPNPVALAREYEGPIAAIYAVSAKEVVVATDGPNFSNLLRWDGATWSSELDRLRRTMGDEVLGFTRAPDGVLWAATNPPQVRKGHAWRDAPKASPILGAEIEALAFPAAGADVVVAGASGLLGPAGDPSLRGPNAGVQGARAIDDGAFVASGGALLWAKDGGFTPILGVGALTWFDAASRTNVAALSLYEGADTNDPNRRLTIYRYDGTSARQVYDAGMYDKDARGLALAPNGDVYFSMTTFPEGGGEPKSELMKLRASSSQPEAVRCNGEAFAARAVWTDGKELLVRSDGNGRTFVAHVDATGACTPLARPLYWADERSIAGTRYTDLWFVSGVSGYKDTTLGRWNGTAPSDVVKIQDDGCGLVVFGSEAWIASCGIGSDAVYRWSNGKIESMPLGMLVDGVNEGWTIWGTDAQHLWLGDARGRILRYRP